MSDVLQHISVFAFQGMMDIQFYRSKLLGLNNSSYDVWILLKSCVILYLSFSCWYCDCWVL